MKKRQNGTMDQIMVHRPRLLNGSMNAIQSIGGGGGGVSSTLVSTGVKTESRFFFVKKNPTKIKISPSTATPAPMSTVISPKNSYCAPMDGSSAMIAPAITRSAPRQTGPERTYERHVR